MHYLEDKTVDQIEQALKQSIFELESISMETKKNTIVKLQGYRLVEDLRDFQPGKATKWLHKQTGKLSSGIHLDVKFTNQGCTIYSKFTKKMIQYRYDNYLSYQKISPEEMVVIYLNTTEKGG